MSLPLARKRAVFHRVKQQSLRLQGLQRMAAASRRLPHYQIASPAHQEQATGSAGGVLQYQGSVSDSCNYTKRVCWRAFIHDKSVLRCMLKE